MEFLLLFLVVSAVMVSGAYASYKQLREGIDDTAKELGGLVARHFAVEACSRCHEQRMRLLSVAPQSRTVQYECLHCKKKRHATVTSQPGLEAAHRYHQLERLIAKYCERYGSDHVAGEVVFSTAPLPLPFEQTTREPIKRSDRSEVFRRDGGACVTCGSTHQLEMDHVTPVSRGGATSVRNLQLLCRPCNRAKGASV